MRSDSLPRLALYKSLTYLLTYLNREDAGPLQPNISVTVPVRKKVSTYHLYETTYRGKNDHVTDDVTWPRKVKTVTLIHLSLNISKSLGDSVSTKGTPIGNGPWASERSCDPMTSRYPEGQGRDPDMFRLSISQTAQDSRLVSMEHLSRERTSSLSR